MARIPLKKLEDQSGESPRRKFCVTDLETMNWTNFVVGGNYDGVSDVRFFTSLDSLLLDLLSRHSGYDCYAHFGGKFDFLFFLGEILKNEKKFVLGPIIPRGSGILSFDLSDTHGNQITFRDSSALLPFGLKRLTENFQVDHIKKEYDHSKTKGVTPELLTYLESDLKGLYEVLDKFWNWPEIQSAGRACTLASQAFRVWRRYLPCNRISSLSKGLDTSIRPAYFGGRVEIFKPLYHGRKSLYCYDVNSLYPYCMRTFDFPTEFLHRTREYSKNDPGIYECDIDMPDMQIPPLGTMATGKLIFPCGSFRGMYCTPEIEYARSLGADIRVRSGYVFKNGGSIFRGFVDPLYAIKRGAKKGSVDETIAKLLLNSCYGRTGIRPEKENIIIDDGTLGLKILRELKVGQKTFRLMKKECELETFSHVGIAIFVTAYGRITTHKKIMEAPQEAYYTDTDSIYTTHEYATGEGLGELKLESKQRSACFLLPKTYIAGKKVVMKGFDSKKTKEFTQNDFEACLAGDLKRLKIVQESKFATLKTAMRQGVLVTMTKQNEKQIRSVYDKRIIFKTSHGYDTRPLRIKSGIVESCSV